MAVDVAALNMAVTLRDRELQRLALRRDSIKRDLDRTAAMPQPLAGYLDANAMRRRQLAAVQAETAAEIERLSSGLSDDELVAEFKPRFF